MTDKRIMRPSAQSQQRPSAQWMMASLAMALLLAGCSKAEQDAPATASAENESTVTAATAAATAADAAAPSDAAAAPDTGAAAVTGADPSVAPGVAFTYQFNFRLPDDNVSLAQDAHIAACARLGQAHCRVTSLAFRKEDTGPVSGLITFLVDPALARGFTRDAVDAVARNDGELVDSQVGGEDVGTGIEASQRGSARLGGDVARLEARLRQPGLDGKERAEIQRQIAAMRGELREAAGQRTQDEARIANTPVEFIYAGTSGIGGYDASRPFASAWRASTSSMGSAASILLTVIGVALPWLLMLAGLVFLFRWARRRFGKGSAATPA